MAYAQTFIHLAQKHGLSGILAFFKLKVGLTKSIALGTLAHPVSLRPNSSDVTTFKHIFAHGDYDFKMVPEPKIIIDAGANIGLASIYFANKYPQAKIISIELAPSNFQSLLRNTSKYEQINAINAGLWHKHHTLKYKEEGASPWGYKVDNNLQENSISVESVTIKDIVDKYNIKVVDLLKVDIEGAEVELFSENYENWLPKVRYLAIEYHDRWRPDSSNTVKSALANFSFKELDQVGENSLYINESL